MKNLICALVALYGWSEIASAETIPVRSGEHGDFTRLVLTVSRDSSWTVQQSGRSAQLVSGKADVRYDVSGVFARIPKTRLSDLSPTADGNLDLSLACECSVETFRQSGKYLVVDIRENLEVTQKDVASSLADPAVRSRFRLQFQAKRADGSAIGSQRTILPQVARSFDAGAQSAETASHVGASLSEQRLVAQIERAARQGLLSPSKNLTENRPPTASTPPSDNAVAQTEDSDGRESDLGISVHVPCSSNVILTPLSLHCWLFFKHFIFRFCSISSWSMYT